MARAVLALGAGLGLDRSAAVRKAAGFASSLRLLRQTASAAVRLLVMKRFGALPFPAAMSLIERPDAMERSSSLGPPTFPSTTASSRCLISIQLALPRS